MVRSAYTDGIIDIELDGENYELNASAKALKIVNTNLGGFQRAIASLQEGDVNALEVVIGAGLSREDAKNLSDKIYKTGAVSLLLPAIQFTMMLVNGGRHPENMEEEKSERPTKKRSAAETS